MAKKVKAAGWARALRWAGRLALSWFAGTFVLVLALRWVDPPTTAFMLERRWAKNEEKKPFVVHQQWVPLSAISPELERAVIAAEDQKFLTHHGFDFEAMGEAFEDRLEGHGTRGASTLTQQVAKNLFLWSARSFFRKGLEAYFTVLIELLWPKTRILEMHLNVAEYGDGIYGAEAAARAFFHKSAKQLNALEAARLATVLPAPRRRNAAALSPTMEARAEHIAELAQGLSPDLVPTLTKR